MLACMLDGGDHGWVLSAIALFVPIAGWVSMNMKRIVAWIKKFWSE